MNKYDLVLDFWKSKEIADAAQLSAAMNGQAISLAYHSGKLENENITYHDTREVFEHDGVTSYTGDLRTLFEIKNSKEAIEYFFTAFEKKIPISEYLIKKMQRILTQNTYDARRWQLGERPGEYKINDYVTGKEEVGALPEDVKEEMDELISEFDDISESDALKAAAYFHAKFENIHPFADGNGRTGRLVMNYILVLHNHPPIIIHEEDRREYYNALESWDSDQDLVPLCDFLRKQAEKTWEKQIRRHH